jgi:hypothetical protein
MKTWSNYYIRLLPTAAWAVNGLNLPTKNYYNSRSLQMELKKIHVQLTGLRPLMFDRYAGDNNTVLPVEEKMYLTKDNVLTMPAVNIYSLLCAENSKSVCKQFFGRAGKGIALGIAGFTTIEPYDIPICDDNGPIKFEGFNEQIYIMRHVARLARGIPNPKERPTLHTPWRLDFTVTYHENKECTLENLRQAYTMGGMLGLGTFRPYFGSYELSWFDEAPK